MPSHDFGVIRWLVVAFSCLLATHAPAQEDPSAGSATPDTTSSLAQTSQLPSPHSRAVFCAANARFMLRHEGRLDADDLSAQQARARIDRWIAYAAATGAGVDISQALEQKELDVYRTFKQSVKTSDPIRDDPFSELVVRGYEDCIISPPAPPDRLRVFQAFIRCSSVARVKAWKLQGRNDPAVAGLIDSSHFLADTYIRVAVSRTMMDREDAEIAHDEGAFELQAELDALSPGAQVQRLGELDSELRECERL